MSTPIFDAVKAQFDDAIASAEQRATMEIKEKVLMALKPIKSKPASVKQLIEELEHGTNRSK
jgi:predicted XRE-type DNA-binding protein